MSAGGSSPSSETSQDAAGSRELQKKKRWKTAFPSATSPDSNSRGSDIQDNSESGKSRCFHELVESGMHDRSGGNCRNTVPLGVFIQKFLHT